MIFNESNLNISQLDVDELLWDELVYSLGIPGEMKWSIDILNLLDSRRRGFVGQVPQSEQKQFFFFFTVQLFCDIAWNFEFLCKQNNFLDQVED